MAENLPPAISSTLAKLTPREIFKDNASLNDIIRYHLDEYAIVEPKEFRIRRRYPEFNTLTDDEIGKIGERAVRLFLGRFNQLLDKHHYLNVVHENYPNESFKPYDFELSKRMAATTYVDVKTTRRTLETSFHISITEAKFIVDHFSKYFFFRVFPLFDDETYHGIRIASNLGMNIYNIDQSFHDEFKSAVLEMEEVYNGKGFLMKSDWLKRLTAKSYR